MKWKGGWGIGTSGGMDLCNYSYAMKAERKKTTGFENGNLMKGN